MEEEEWINVESVGNAPIRRTYAYKSWRIDVWYYINGKGEVKPFPPVYVLRLGRWRKEFQTDKELNKYLTSKGLPPLPFSFSCGD